MNDIKRVNIISDGYNLNDNPRPSGRTDGGVSILFKIGFLCNVVSSGELDSLEYAS